MTTPLTLLDEFLEVPDAQRDVTRVVRMLVNDARSLMLVVAERRCTTALVRQAGRLAGVGAG